MILAMAGFDHTTSSLEEREQLALTQTEIREMLASVSGRSDVEGCVYVSTCGRGELYLYCEETVDVSGLLAEEIAARKGACTACHAALPTEKMAAGRETGPGKETEPGRETEPGNETGTENAVFRGRSGHDAVDHLFHTACGMRSQIYGEDQILAQLKQSLELAREAQAAGGVTERLFLSAIAAGKKVKTAVRLTAVPTSVADRMIFLLKGQTEIRGKNCLVIGNGEIGRLCASKLLEEGAKVTVTVRNYRTREVIIPVGSRIVDYRDRLQAVPEADIIVSATTSPHFTLPYPAGMHPDTGGHACADSSGGTDTERGNPLLDGRERWLFDLALPRDIAPEYGRAPNLHLFELDEVSAGKSEKQTDAAARAEEILEAEEENFFRWLDFRKANRQAVHVGELAADDVTARVHKRLKKALEGDTAAGSEHRTAAPLCAEDAYAAKSDGTTVSEKSGRAVRQAETDSEEIDGAVLQVEAIYEDAVRKVVDNLMYDLRGRISEEQYRTVVEAMEQSVLARASDGSGGRTAGRQPEHFRNVPEAAEPPNIPGTQGIRNVSEAAEPQNNPGTQGIRNVPEATNPQNPPTGRNIFNYFPLFLDTREKTVLIYGAGRVALRRVRKLLDFACGIWVIAPEAEDALIRLAEQFPQRIRYEKRRFTAEKLICLLDTPNCNRLNGRAAGGGDGKEADRNAAAEKRMETENSDGGGDAGAGDILFVVAATDRREVNREIGAICRARGMPVSVADRQEESGCYFPGIAMGTMGMEGVQIVAGISSEGADHRRTAQAVKKAEELLAGNGGDTTSTQ